MSESNFLKAYKANVEHLAKGSPSKVRRVVLVEHDARKVTAMWLALVVCGTLMGFALGYFVGISNPL
jgi:Na+/citrate or Na+/malate symporter